MYLVFADDSGQKNPFIKSMGELTAVGGLFMPADEANKLEIEIKNYCNKFNFSDYDVFKWSPGNNENEKFFKTTFLDQKRTDFFCSVLGLAKNYGAKAIVVIEDKSKSMAQSLKSKTHEKDVLDLFCERLSKSFKEDKGLIIFDNPGGGASDKKLFNENCFETILHGTDYVRMSNIPFGIIPADKKFIRLLQLADIIVSCSIARVAGENKYSIPVFEKIVSIFDRSESGRISGYGLKIWPHHEYQNLYYWLFDATTNSSNNETLNINLQFSQNPYK